jgi:hypothetical protein
VSRVDLTRRDLLASAGAATGMFLFAGGAQLLRSGPSPFKVTMTTLFWVGEPSTVENDFIWQTNYGGVDDPGAKEQALACRIRTEAKSLLHGFALW